MSRVFSPTLDPEERRVLKLCRKRRKLTCRDVDWWTLTGLVKKSLLDRIVPSGPNTIGWSYFKLSHRGKSYVKRLTAQ